MSKGKVVITGAAGLLGSHLIQPLLLRGHSVVGLDNLRLGNRRNIEKFLSDPRFTFEQKDILSREDMVKVCTGAECIVHLAAEKIPWG
ncbi:MAG: NAD-dependent epimerase/dehydratase family protein [Bacteroidota bacterium]